MFRNGVNGVFTNASDTAIVQREQALPGVPRRASGLPRRGATVTDNAARDEAGADAGRNVALQRLSVSAAPVTLAASLVLNWLAT